MKFIVTHELGRLARWLRLAGYDTLYYTHDTLGTLIVTALRDGRMIVTRRKEKIGNLAGQTIVLTAIEIRAQLRELAAQITLAPDERAIFSRCAACNGVLAPVEKDIIAHQVPACVLTHQSLFMRCATCGKIYWQGTHASKIKEIIDTLR